MSVPLRSLRLGTKGAQTLNSLTGASGEIFYDSTNQTLRVYPGRITGGAILATQEWTQSQRGQLTSLSTAARDLITPTAGQTIYNTTLNKIQGYQAGQWVDLDGGETVDLGSFEFVGNTIQTTDSSDIVIDQKVTITDQLTVDGLEFTSNTIRTADSSGIVIDQQLTVTDQLTAGFLTFAMGVPVNEFSNDDTMADDSSSAAPVESAVRGYIDRRLGIDHNGNAMPLLNLIGPGYAALDGATFTGNLIASNNVPEGLNVVGGATLGLSQERYLTIGISSTTPTHTLGPGYFGWTSIFNCSGQTANFTPNIEGVPTTGNSLTGIDTVITFTYIMNQGASNPGLPTALKLNNVAQTIKWQGGTAPSGTANKVDVVSFNCFITASTGSDGLYTVLGSMTSFG